ncbi:GNAT family N-acetyltransferase [Actinomycetospora chiangmaiensis]|uniref:GNAT family N-acetyltransferase n=1 Tax=Actinomycetospora chiangmaiensis TaxID=402650 RepID=UPI000A06E80F
MRIRRATPDDLDDLLGLASALFAEDGGSRDPDTDVDWPRTHGRPYYAGLVRDPRSLVLLVETDQGIVGFVSGRLADHDVLRPGVVGAELESMFVTAAWRSRGAGRALAEHFRRWASSMAPRKLRSPLTPGTSPLCASTGRRASTITRSFSIGRFWHRVARRAGRCRGGRAAGGAVGVSGCRGRAGSLAERR